MKSSGYPIFRLSQHRKFLVAAFILLFSAGFSKALACETHWIRGISDCGRIVQLDDHSSWNVHSIDVNRVLNWRLGEHVVICKTNGKIKNKDKDPADQQWVNVKPLSWLSRSKSKNSCELNPNQGDHP